MSKKGPAGQRIERVVFNLAIETKPALYMAWMPILVGGGLFIPTKHSFELGDEIEANLTLLHYRTPASLCCRVVWITPPGSHRIQGVGVQLPDSDLGRKVANKIEIVLAEVARSPRATYTL